MKDIPEFKLIAEPLGPSAIDMKSNSWCDPAIGTRHKIGGKPDFIQAETWPRCTVCKQVTSFYGQLDSLNDENGQYDIADCGMIYVFFCFSCNEATTVVQSY